MGPLCTSHHCCCCCCVTRGVFIQHSDCIVHGAERRLFGTSHHCCLAIM